jgi:hypothetical protein
MPAIKNTKRLCVQAHLLACEPARRIDQHAELRGKMSKKRSFTALVIIAVSASLPLAIVVPTQDGRAAAPLTGQQLAAVSRTNSDLVNGHLLAPPTATVALQPSEAYPDSTLRGSATFGDPDGDLEGASTYRWLVNSNQIAAGEVAQSLLLPLDGSLLTTDGQAPTQNDGLTFVAGRFGQAVQTSEDDDSRLSYVAANNVDPNEGSLETWVNLAYDLDDPAYDDYPRLFSYVIDDEHQLYIEVNADRVTITSRNEGSYYGTWPSPPGWRSGDWHHLATTWSASTNRIAVYYDCVLVDEGDFPTLTGSADHFHLGSAESWAVMDAAFDDVRLSRRALSAAEITATCSRGGPTPHDEVVLLPGQAAVGDEVTFELMPCDDTGACGAPASASVTIAASPLGPLKPVPGLLPSGTVSVTLSLTTTALANCRWSGQPNTPYDDMLHSFQQGQGTTSHSTAVEGLSDLDNRWFYVRCADLSQGADTLSPLRDPDTYERWTHLRVLPEAAPPFPRTGNLWGWWELADNGLPHLARIDLLLGADDITAGEIAELRDLNPHIIILTSINAVENAGLPDDYYLKDVNGNRIEVWPNSYRLNLTKDYVAEYQADYAYQTLLDTSLMADGVFFDNVFTSQSWLTHDIYGNEVQIDADEDGLPDDPDELDAAWKAGVFHEIQTFRALMPHAIVSGHAMDIYEPGIADLFNGISIGFWTADVLQGEMTYTELQTLYDDWLDQAKEPPVTMFESSPLDEIAYGYDYEPWAGKVPTSTLEFARTYYPWMRFGLALTLMNDGYFAHEFGDTWHGNDWWYDELDFYLGHPLGPAQRVDLGGPPPLNQLENGDFEDAIGHPWSLWASAGDGCLASVTRDTSDVVSGTASARVDVMATSGVDWHIEFAQYERSWQQNTHYDLTFWAKSDQPRTVTLSAQKGSPDWDNYGLWREVAIDTQWQPYTVTFQANATASDSRIQFLVGKTTGTVWLDDVHLNEHPPDVYQREFTHGLVLLNATREAQTIDVGPGYRRLAGNQAPLYEAILDDADPTFSTSGTWTACTYDSGQWQASGPFYHDWGEGCHEGSDGQARWDLSIATSDTYTITAWWPAAPESVGWNASAIYQVIAGGQVVTTTTLDQRTGGDKWHFVAAVPLDPSDLPYVRLTCQGGAPCIADALHVRSEARYNNGSPVGQITLPPMDGIVLQREWAHSVFLPLVFR